MYAGFYGTFLKILLSLNTQNVGICQNFHFSCLALSVQVYRSLFLQNKVHVIYEIEFRTTPTRRLKLLIAMRICNAFYC